MNSITYRDNQLYVDNVALATIAHAVGTPAYVYSRRALEWNWQEFNQGFSPRTAAIRYSVKSNSNLAILALMAKLGSGFDIVSGGELERVIRAHGKANQTVFSGVAKSKKEIEFALKSGIFSLNVESPAELARIHITAKSLGVVAPVSVRVNPDVDAITHPHISTGLREAKFGVDFEQALELFRDAHHSEQLNIIGIAVHIGSQMTSLEPIIDALEHVIDFSEQLGEVGIEIHHLDLGGGLGVRYRDEQPPTIREYCSAIGEVLDRRNAAMSLSIEPGRAITANAGVLVTRVEYIKQTATKNFALVDGAMNDLIRPVLYDAWMDIVEVRQDHNIEAELYDVVGPVCETGDYLGKNRMLAIDPGDRLAVLGAGAYGAVMASNYNTRPRPVEILVDDEEFDVIRSRESIDEMLCLESIPDQLSPD